MRRFKRTDRIWVPALAFASVVGSPTEASRQRWPGWSFPDSATTIVNLPYVFPDDWGRLSIELYWTNTVSSSGDVRWLVGHSRQAGDGDTLGTETGTVATYTAPTLDVLKVSSITTIDAPADQDAILLAIRRDGSDGLDTLTNAALAFGLLLTKAG